MILNSMTDYILLRADFSVLILYAEPCNHILACQREHLMPLKLDLLKDYACLLRHRLAAKGYPSPASETDEEALTRYLNMLNRAIEPRARLTKKTIDFACPPDDQAGLNALIKVSQDGGNLRPYQSTGMEKDKYDDGMLNDWGFHHFHLGTGPHPMIPGYVNRTGPLLYAVVTPDSLYCIAILQHQQWSNQQLLEVMQRDFPDLTKAGTFKNNTLKPQSLAVNYTDTEVQQFRDAGINAIMQRSDGSIMMGSGGGVTLSRKKGQRSAKIAIANTDVRRLLQDAEDSLNELVVSAGVPDGHEVHLIEENGLLIVRDAPGALRAELPQILKPLG